MGRGMGVGRLVIGHHALRDGEFGSELHLRVAGRFTQLGQSFSKVFDHVRFPLRHGGMGSRVLEPMLRPIRGSACHSIRRTYIVPSTNMSSHPLDSFFEGSPMARIPLEVVERLKTQVSVQRLAEARGVVLEKRGADLHGRCPFHDDRTPSLVITPAKNLWHCLGACQTGGSVIDWVMRAEGVSFRYAVELLKSNHPSLAAGAGRVVGKGSTAKLEAPIEARAGDAEILRQVVTFYHETLKESPEAM